MVNGNGFIGALSKIGKHDVFETILGLIFIFGGGYLYIKYFYNFEGQGVLSMMIIGMLVVGLVFFGDGSYRWRNRHEKEEVFGDKKRELELKRLELENERKQFELDNVKRPFSGGYVAT